MSSFRKTRQQLIDELALASRRIDALEARLTKIQDLKQTLTASEQRYRAVIETQSDLICRLLPDGTISFVNRAYCRFYGKSQTELIMKK